MNAVPRQFVKKDHCREMHEVLRADLQMLKGMLPRLQTKNEVRKEVKKEKNGRVECFSIKPRWFELLINRPIATSYLTLFTKSHTIVLNGVGHSGEEDGQGAEVATQHQRFMGTGRGNSWSKTKK